MTKTGLSVWVVSRIGEYFAVKKPLAKQVPGPLVLANCWSVNVIELSVLSAAPVIERAWYTQVI